MIRCIDRKLRNIPAKDFDLSDGCWNVKEYRKGDVYNPLGSICRYLGFTLEGYFRAYLIDKKGEEVNMLHFPPGQLVITYKSFIHESPCEFNTVAMTDARVICITLADLQRLY